MNEWEENAAFFALEFQNLNKKMFKRNFFFHFYIV